MAKIKTMDTKNERNELNGNVPNYYFPIPINFGPELSFTPSRLNMLQISAKKEPLIRSS